MYTTHTTGQRVLTPHGAGTVQGFESFDLDGKTRTPSTTDNGGRVIVALDNPENWAGSKITTTPPHYYRGEVTPT